jgi:ribosomal protein S18 acetylase RimI-like enzyme
MGWLMPDQNDEPIIRPARATDAVTIARVRVAAWRAGYRGLIPDSYLDRSDFEQAEAQHLYAALHAIADEARIAVAELGGQVVGYCAYGSVEDNDGKLTQGGVYDLFVHPDTWRRGVGRRLLMYATEHLKTQGFHEARLFVFEANARGRAFYQRAGWEADGYREIEARPGFALPVLRYRKALIDGNINERLTSGAL